MPPWPRCAAAAPSAGCRCSVLKGTARPGSDVDLLVEFEPGAKPSLFTLAAIEREMSEQLGGRRVDLRAPQELSRYFRDEVLGEAEVRYDSAGSGAVAPLPTR